MTKNYSNNYGQPIEKAIVPTLAETINLFDKLRRSGKVFRVDFVKRSTGTRRTMVCRFGVTKHLKGGKKAFDAGDKGLFTVWEFGKGYRSIAIDNLILLKTAGQVYYFNTKIPPGDYTNADTPYNTMERTISAATSPLKEASI